MPFVQWNAASLKIKMSHTWKCETAKGGGPNTCESHRKSLSVLSRLMLCL